MASGPIPKATGITSRSVGWLVRLADRVVIFMPFLRRFSLAFPLAVVSRAFLSAIFVLRFDENARVLPLARSRVVRLSLRSQDYARESTCARLFSPELELSAPSGMKIVVFAVFRKNTRASARTECPRDNVRAFFVWSSLQFIVE